MTLKTLDSCSLVITGIFASFLLVACQPSEEVGGSDMPVSDTSPMDASVAMPTEAITTFTTEHLASKSSFYIGGEYVGDPPVMGGQMYVDVWEPNNITQPYPIVLFHGNGQTGVGWQQTPDGRPGWAYYLLEQGYVLYMVDYPARGRSAYLPGGVHGDLGIRTAAQLQTIWTNVDEMGDFPLNDNHTQWPGEGKPGDPVFDEFIKTQVQFAGQSTTLARHAAIELLQEIGPVILLTHSQGGGVGFGVTDGAPGLVKALITVEPGGPQIGRVSTSQVAYTGAPANAWGPVNYPLTYDPAVSDPSELNTYLEEEADRSGEVPCWLQEEPAKQLVNFLDVPILSISADGTYHRVFDACIPKWLNQAGAQTDFFRLEEVGISGNGHMMQLELNSDDIIEFIHEWIQEKVE
ncbi:MAG: alpha/beta fold hydrolase [Gammaproteobacteria bacterium]|jgi:pimeloyl-ACP methyl ester carboxylesterase|nr:alpha/beta fold hydrolase [Gammaproteobacteria bacterium]